MTGQQLGVSPSGHLHLFFNEHADDDLAALPLAINAAFAQGIAEGLIALAAEDSGFGYSPNMSYWRTFCCLYLTERCRLTQFDPAHPEPVSTPEDAQLAALLAGAPPMRGGEYLSAPTLAAIWRWLDDWLCQQIGLKGSLAAFLEASAPRWHQVGRVYFHLAENKLDRDYPFAFMATYVPEHSGQAKGKIRHQPLAHALKEYAGAGNKAALIRLLSPMQRASQSSALIKALVENGDIYHPLAWTPAEAHAFLKEAQIYEHCGVIVRLPNWWKQRSRPQVSITIGNAKQRKLGADALLDFRLAVVLGDDALTAAETQALLAAQDGLTFVKGQWVEVDGEKLAEALAHWHEVAVAAGDDGLSFAEGMRLLAGAPAQLDAADTLAKKRPWAFVRAGAWLGGVLDELRAPEMLRAVDPGGALKADLRPYQKTGVSWLWLLSQLGLGACLADDMGLGKTMQVIALLLVLKKKRDKVPSLLVLPASLLANWQTELARFGPSLRCRFVHPSRMSKADIMGLASDGAALEKYDLVVTTYSLLLRQTWLAERTWRLLVLDEAQAIKNAASRQSRVVKKFKASARIALTGTPIENQLGDLWSLFDFLCPGLLGSARQFKSFVKSLSAGEGSQYAPLRNLVGPYILRRLKTDKSIIADLPDKTEMRTWCTLSRAQAVLYRNEVRKLTAALEKLDGMQRRGWVLASLMRLKQICNHPSQLLDDGLYHAQASGKFVRLAELCEEIAARQERMLVFTQFREIVDPLSVFLAARFGRPGLVLHGGTPVKQRGALVTDFQREDGPPFFILSLRAGGVGLNLTAASHVVHFDRWWNPAVENQATDRAFRIGQRNNVLVHKFVCQGTVEEKIDALITEKTAIADALLEGGAELMLTEMNDRQLLQLVSLDINTV